MNIRPVSCPGSIFMLDEDSSCPTGFSSLHPLDPDSLPHFFHHYVTTYYKILSDTLVLHVHRDIGRCGPFASDVDDDASLFFLHSFSLARICPLPFLDQFRGFPKCTELLFPWRGIRWLRALGSYPSPEHLYLAKRKPTVVIYAMPWKCFPSKL